jgi:hypothetical protein
LGTRGSLASPGPETVRYGGNTACADADLDAIFHSIDRDAVELVPGAERISVST